ncbi:MAG: DUF4382 domain-containing protein [Gammaproteobacteria bacterium]|uniref:DUF4382 domain-containing protein n=1 Tax=Limnobacter sp. TaxID=2003368 RepID=UPI001DE63C86|nr:DUF4382 domain-containing protein [Limnobacter sp.]MBU0782547.1 DUF4382 domain-containing protein [Gammaproteobacteria bacterium]MBU0850135.1 DUF4382 domain-containing protein [Gammaproteobacteria bacterium]MBU1268623.1 DUF4382 domain-containing protein [Gammaproteobacteria bacterium]MBU1530047.1 DUF4382 domain-containing protein [Gammaproteobacteria bacterium]MBU1780894.1 DUF4382 domain-containing protein [Gammaproteobacteria bacterium]
MTKRKSFIRSTLAATCAALFVAACGGGGDSGGTGTLRTAMTDAPACGYDNVFVTVDRIRVNNSANAEADGSGWSEVVLDRPRQIDLLNLQNGVIEELGEVTLPVGRVQQVRFVLVDNATADPADIDFDPDADPTRAPNHVVFSAGGAEDLKTPSGQQSGVKINVGIDVAEGQVADLLIDFDACKSVVEAGGSGNYLLKPVLSAIPRLSSGVRGSVADAQVPEGVSISLQQNGEIFRSTAPIVNTTNLDENGNFILSQVPPGTYDLVVTAQGFITKVVTDVVVPEGVLVNLDPDSTTAVDENEIVLVPATVEGDADGTVTNTDEIKPATFVNITQTLSVGTTVLIDSAQLSFETFDTNGNATGMGNTAPYLFDFLTVDAPEVAPYTPNGTFNYAIDTAVEGQYTVVAVAEPVDAAPVEQTASANFDPGFVGTTEAPRERITNNFDLSSAPAP